MSVGVGDNKYPSTPIKFYPGIGFAPHLEGAYETEQTPPTDEQSDQLHQPRRSPKDH